MKGYLDTDLSAPPRSAHTRQKAGGDRLGICRLLLVLLLLLSWGCKGSEQEAGSRAREISAWFHTGRPAETRVILDQVDRFNSSQQEVRIKLTLIPEGDYNTQVQAAAADGKLPDLLDLDGPFLANYAWKGHLVPLDGLLAEPLKSELLPSIIKQGTYRGSLYAIGTFDSGLGLYADREKLMAIKARLPATPEEAWDIAEFERILAALARQDADGRVLDLRMDYRGEWYTFAFSPTLQSAGGDLIDRAAYRSAKGVLNGVQSVQAMTTLQAWFQKGYIDANLDANSFVDGDVALSWCGHWEYPRYREALGERLVLLPLPDFGRGSRTGMGSWTWAITRNCRSPQLAARFLEFLLSKDEVLAMVAANSAVPATRSAVASSPLYQENGPLHLFVQQLERSAVPRPRTPAYPVITSAFQQAFLDIRHGADVRRALDAAVAVIDEDIEDNNGYPQMQ